MTKRNLRPIVLAEDDENDVLLLRLAMVEAGFRNELVVARDGGAAIDWLGGLGNRPDSQRWPSLILLDLKMPCRDGFEVLQWLRGRAEFKDVPVVILSSSGDKVDRNRAAALGAADFCVKVATVKELAAILKRLQPYVEASMKQV